MNEIRRSALDDGTGNALCVSARKFPRIADEKEFVTLRDTEQRPSNNRVGKKRGSCRLNDEGNVEI